jgi:Transposase DDE domain/Transposase domain (DUF772)
LSLARLSSKNHPLAEIFAQIDKLFRCLEPKETRRGRPNRFQDVQIIKCVVYQIHYRIVSFRELEWRLRRDFWVIRAIGLSEIPDHTTFCRRIKRLEADIFGILYHQILSELTPETRVCYWDSTALRSSRYDRDAEKSKGTRLGWYYGYKLHLILTQDWIPLNWDITPAGFYDNQFPSLLQGLRPHPVFFLLADAAYDDQKLFATSDQLGIHLVTQVNMRNASSSEEFTSKRRRQNAYYVKQGLGKKLLPQRNGIERFFSLLKSRYGVEQTRLFGLSRYARHVHWVIMVYLLERLVDQSLGFHTRKAPWNR